MDDYRAPVKDMYFVLTELADADHIATLPGYEESSRELIKAVLDESARFHGNLLAPLNHSGDREASHIEDRGVVPASGFADAYQQYTQAGWGALAMNTAFGGQGLPITLTTAVMEMTQTANLAFSLCPMLTQGAARTLEAHGSDALKDAYLHNMISGQWSGTMNLTESQAGSDLGAVKCRAEPEDDHYVLKGQKIFITWGDHNMADNIVHLVLARIPGAPAGSSGISLFLVPKYLLDDDGSPGQRNDVYATALEHKLGINASPTCVMNFGDDGGAIGYLVGEQNKGLAHMFTMMNEARLDVGLQGLGVSERAYQQALGYARERVQGRGQTIIHHPDVRRMLMLMKAACEAMRAVVYTTRACQDLAHHAPDADIASANATRVDLMTPIVKGWFTELANEICSLGIQVHGGMGFIEETGAAQYYRDARILAIYEGTNGIQALDLVGRKLIRDGGRAMASLLADMDQLCQDLQHIPADAPGADAIAAIATRLDRAVDGLHEATDWILQHHQETALPDSVAFNLLMQAGYTCGGWQMARAALVAAQRLAEDSSDAPFYRAKITTARFFAEHYLPRAAAHLDTIKAGASSIVALEEEQF
jgi:alkylation response protein AidB-like acyl-CoA dehydrogenase